jgi:hypothetical protein
MEETIDKFIAELHRSVDAGTFVKLTLGNYKGTDEHLQKIFVRPVETRKGPRLLFQYRGKTSDTTKNFDHSEAVQNVGGHLNTGFRTAHLFTTENDFQITVGKRSAKISTGKPTFKTADKQSHDREKHYRIDSDVFYLKALGITTDKGEIRSDQRDKWKQINKFVEIIDGLYESSDLKNKSILNIVDMGSGKGYLTFAAYDHFSRKLTGQQASSLRVTGVETRSRLVSLCSDLAAAGDYDGLKFVQGSIADFEPGDVDILIALHACNTATDDALYKGIAAKASIIVAAPCCHHEIKGQMRPPDFLAGILKHPVLLERTAETITDGLRSLILERAGYKTKMFEFVATEHTPKNNMLVAVRNGAADPSKNAEIDAIMKTFGIQQQSLLDRFEDAARV